MFSRQKNRGRPRQFVIAFMCGLLVFIAGCGAAPAKEPDVRRSLKVMFLMKIIFSSNTVTYFR